jgi:hypothetical protein
MLVDDIKLIIKDLDHKNVKIVDISYLLIYLYLLNKNFQKIKVKPILLLFLPILLKSSHFTADFFSGIFHYVMDTYNIKGFEDFHINFRKHHQNVLSMENFPLSETLTEVMPLGFIPLICNLFITEIANKTDNDLLMIANIQSILTNIVGTSTQVAHRLAHRRNHEYTKDGIKQFYIPDFIKWLQDNEIILSPKHHSNHHKTEVMNYCITNGSSSSFFDKIIDIFDLPVSNYSNSNNIHTEVPRKLKRKIINSCKNNV